MGIKHTPGPWKWVQLDFSGYYHELHDKSGTVICDDGSAQGEYSAQIDVKGANARLIAAAPELLEALEDALIDFDNWAAHEDNHPHEHLVVWAEKARAAIAKAKGEEQ